MEAHINIAMVIKEKQCLQIFSQKPLRVPFYSEAAKLLFHANWDVLVTLIILKVNEWVLFSPLNLHFSLRIFLSELFIFLALSYACFVLHPLEHTCHLRFPFQWGEVIHK